MQPLNQFDRGLHRFRGWFYPRYARNPRLTVFLLGSCSLFAVASSAALSAAPASRPNVLFIAIDDLRDWTGYLGRNPQAKTPNLDRLAGMGLTFTRAYCAAPVCNPSRTAVMSGLRPSTSGIYDNPADWRTAIAPDKTLPTAFRNAGYHVIGAGKIYHEAYARRSEWDDYFEQERSNPKPSADQDKGVGGLKFAVLDCRDDELDDYGITNYGIAALRKKHDQPFFLAVGLHKPHLPWNVPRKYFDLFPLEHIQLPPHLVSDLDDVPPAGVKMAFQNNDHANILKSGRWKEAVQAYLAAIAYTDMNIGRLLDAFEKSPHRDNTIICLWGDHGWHLGEKQHWRKFALWEEATRTPFIWVVPGVTRPGSRSDRPVDLMSVYPTLMELCGIPKPAHVEGASVRPLLAQPDAPWREPALTTHLFGNHGLRVDGWRYIRYADGTEELYDETRDPNEWTNLAKNPDHAARIAELKKFLPKKNAADISTTPGRSADGGESPEAREARKAQRKANREKK